METSQEGIELIAKHEGFRSEAYLDVAGIPTIGYGHTNDNVYPVWMGMPSISEEKGKEILQHDLKEAENAVKRYTKVDLLQSQFDALVSFVFNIGAGNYSSSTLLKRINENPFHKEIREQWYRWNRAGGSFWQGLLNRRVDEVNHYFSDKKKRSYNSYTSSFNYSTCSNTIYC